MKTICVALIVKNEEKVISRCINSIKNYIDYWVICDTGSTDKTKEIIEKELSEIPGELHNTAWKNFGHNRTELMRLAKGKADYLLLIDADMTLDVHQEDFKQNLSCASYMVRYNGDIDYRQKLLVDGSLDWEYVGVTHEHINSKNNIEATENINSISLNHFCDGARRPEKFENDIKLLKSGLKKEPQNERYMFYLAQSYFDLGKYKLALKWYEKRIEAKGWAEEVYFSMLKKAHCLRFINKDFPFEAYAEAFEFRPSRLEAVYEIIKHCRENSLYNMGYWLSKDLINKPYPNSDILFIDRDIYEYKLLDEVAICAYWVGLYRKSNDLCSKLLYDNKIPPHERERIQNNKNFAENKLREKV